jgi:hypothetical protein
MLLYLIDRVGTPTCIYGAVAWGSWQLRELTHLSLAYGIIALASLWYFNLLITAIYNAVWHMLRHRNHEFWWSMFETASKGKSSSRWTLESMLMGERIIFTADEENMKAILATQFGSYGKGPQFRKEWKDFLGLSKFALVRQIEQFVSDVYVQASSRLMETCGTTAAS